MVKLQRDSARSLLAVPRAGSCMATAGTDGEEMFRGWSNPSSETEQAKSDHAGSLIRSGVYTHMEAR
jgi:hypothetical protein